MPDYPLDHSLGFAKLPRDARTLEPLMQDGTALQVWIWLLCRARHEPGMVMGSKGPVRLERGDVLVGVRPLAEEIRSSKSAVDRALGRLEELGLIVVNAGQLGSVVTVREYGDFDGLADAERDSRGTAPGQPRDGSGTAAGHKKRRRGEEEKRDLDLPQHGVVLAEALRGHLVAEKPDHELADDPTWQRRRPKWVRDMAPIATKRTEAAALEVLRWVFGDQDGRTEYRFRVDSPRALAEKFDRIETAMRAPRGAAGGRGGGDGTSPRDLWEWAEELEVEEKAAGGGR